MSYQHNTENQGWIDNQEFVNVTLATMPAPYFDQAKGDLVCDEKTEVLLYEHVRAVTGQDAPKGPQKIGDCVSWASACFANYMQCVVMALHLQKAGLLSATQQEKNDFFLQDGDGTGRRQIFEPAASEAIYALGRVEVGHQKGSMQDGSTGSWNAQAIAKYGYLSRPDLGRLGFSPDYDPNRAKSWGAKGLPDELEPIAHNHLVKMVSQVSNFKDAAALIQNGRPVIVCSNRGFTMQRDSQGFCKPQGVWQHGMCFISVRWDRPGLLCNQNWGPNCPTGPVYKAQPDNTFWVDASVVDYMLSQKDSYSGTELDGYFTKDVTLWRH